MKFAMFQITLLFIAVSVVSIDGNLPYYWRNYNGVIPSDAIPGGYDSGRRPTYIGQAFINGQGIIPGVIYPGRKEITIPIFGVKKINSYVKILCSRHWKSFKWLRFSDIYFKLSLMINHLVKGGIENNKLLYIGRMPYQRQLITGKIVSQKDLYIPCGNKEIKSQVFEYLIYNNSSNNEMCVPFP